MIRRQSSASGMAPNGEGLWTCSTVFTEGAPSPTFARFGRGHLLLNRNRHQRHQRSEILSVQEHLLTGAKVRDARVVRRSTRRGGAACRSPAGGRVELRPRTLSSLRGAKKTAAPAYL